MLDRILALFDDRSDEAPARRRDALHMAAAALLVEVARSDDTIDARERARILAMVRQRFGLDADDARTLLRHAEARTQEGAGLFDYVQTIIARCPPDERVWIIEMLWEVVYADGHVADLESNLLRRIGGLLHVSDRERGEARKRVRERLGLEENP